MSPYSGSGRPTGTDFFSGRTTPMSVPPSGRATPQSVYAWSGPETQEVSAVNLSMSDTEVLAALAEQATSQLLEQGQRIVATALVDSKMAITDLQTAIESAPTYKQAILALDETSRMVAAQHAALQEALEASAAVQALLNSRPARRPHPTIVTAGQSGWSRPWGLWRHTAPSPAPPTPPPAARLCSSMATLPPPSHRPHQDATWWRCI